MLGDERMLTWVVILFIGRYVFSAGQSTLPRSSTSLQQLFLLHGVIAHTTTGAKFGMRSKVGFPEVGI